MITFQNKPELKEMLLEEIKKHREADEIIQGTYGGTEGPWCAVGCSVHSLNVKLGKNYDTSDHSVYETELGIPIIIAKLEDRIFEGLPSNLAKDFPYEFIEAVGVGKDLSLVWPKFAVWLLTDKEHGVINYTKNKKTSKSIQNVSDLYDRVIKGEVVGITEWKTVQNAAANYADAAYAVADAAAAYAAAAAADAYADAVAAYAARIKTKETHYAIMADKLIEIISETK